VTIECFDTGEELSVVAKRDQNLCARTNGGLEDGKRSGGELVLFDLRDFVLARQQSALRVRCWGAMECIRQLGTRLGEQLPAHG
jgi:hypothetical protein